MVNPLPDQFPTSVAGLPTARAAEIVELAGGDRFELRIAPMAKRLGDVTVRMLAYNGSIPGPTRLGEVVRFYLTNTANTRVFKVALPGAPVKLVGGDSGRVEHEEIVDHVVLAPSERAVVDVLFDGPRELVLEHHTPDRTYRLASIEVSGDRAVPLGDRFDALRTNADMVAERQRIAPYLEAEPDKVLSFLAEMDMGAPDGDGPSLYSCPMHPEVVSEQPDHCPTCRMKLLPAALVADAATHGHDHGHHDHHDGGHAAAAADGIEWGRR